MASWIRFGVVWVVCVGLTVLLGIPADGAQWAGIPVLWWCFALAFLVQWVAFVPAYLKQTEHFFDLTGSLTYLAVMVGSLGLSALERPPGPAQWLVSAAVTVWAVRLGTFLFRRVKAEGGDGRFDDLKPSVPKFLIVDSTGGVGPMTALALLVNTGSALQRLQLWAPVWVSVSPLSGGRPQKREFRRDPTQADFIQSGLWGWSQHRTTLVRLFCGPVCLSCRSAWWMAGVFAVPSVRSSWRFCLEGEWGSASSGAGRGAMGRRPRVPALPCHRAGPDSATTATRCLIVQAQGIAPGRLPAALHIAAKLFLRVGEAGQYRQRGAVAHLDQQAPGA